MMLVRGSTENAAETSVAPAYAASGQNMRGTSMRSRRAMRSATHSTPVMVRSTSAATMDNCSDAAKASSE